MWDDTAADDFAKLLLLMLVTMLVGITINHGPGGLLQWWRAKFLGKTG